MPGGRTRLTTRLHTVYAGPLPGAALAVLLMEFGDFPMMRRMLRGIRERAEAEHRRRIPPATHRHQLPLTKAAHTAAWATIEACVAHLLRSAAR
jgi:hypothetical protein